MGSLGLLVVYCLGVVPLYGRFWLCIIFCFEGQVVWAGLERCELFRCLCGIGFLEVMNLCKEVNFVVSCMWLGVKALLVCEFLSFVRKIVCVSLKGGIFFFCMRLRLKDLNCVQRSGLCW